MIILGDCIEKIKEMSDNSIHCIITSPPLGDDWSYKNFPHLITFAKEFDISWDFPTLAKEMYRVLMPGGMLCWHVGTIMVNNTESFVPIRQSFYFVDTIGFNPFTTIIFKRTQDVFPRTKVKYHNSFEYIFCFSKGMPKTYNPLHESDIWEGMTRSQEDILSLISENGDLNVDMKNSLFTHQSKTPIWLTRDLILTFSNIGDTILDPFAGSGTTITQSEKLNRIGIGIEINKKYIK